MSWDHAATSHLYGIWSFYASLDPSAIDPSLGTEDDLKVLVRDCHERGIRVFLEVIAHGVLHESPIVKAHPEWFRSSSWGMADFDYSHPGFRAWWRDLFVRYAVEYGVDGFRIDVAMGDASLWCEIVEAAQEAGKEIVVFPENERFQVSQQDVQGAELNPVRTLHVRDFLGIPRGLSTAQLSCHDYGREGLPGNHYYLRGSRALAARGAFLAPRIPVFFAGEEFDAEAHPLPSLTRGLFGDGGPGGWLYGARLDWSELEDPERAAMFADVTEMLARRRRFARFVNGTPPPWRSRPIASAAGVTARSISRAAEPCRRGCPRPDRQWCRRGRGWQDPPMGTVSEYLASLAPEDADAVGRVYAIARELAPEAVEGTSYGMPALILDGKPLISVMRARTHVGVYPFSADAVAAVAEAVDAVPGTSRAKGTIRFQPAHPLRDAVVRALVEARLAQVRARD